MPRWIIKETKIFYADRLLVSPDGEAGQQLEETEVETTSTINTELTPTISGIPYPQAFGNDTTELSISILNEYPTVHDALAAQASELAFVRANPKGELSVGYTFVTRETSMNYQVIAEGEENASYKWCHIDASRLSFFSEPTLGSNKLVTEVHMWGPNVIYEDSHIPIYLGIFEADTAELSETPRLLAASTEPRTMEKNALTAWPFSPGFTLTQGKHMRIQAYAADTFSGPPTWSVNPPINLRSKVHVLADDFDYETSSFCASTPTDKAIWVPRLEVTVTGYNLPATFSRTYPTTIVSELSHRITLGSHSVRLISMWRFTAALNDFKEQQ